MENEFEHFPNLTVEDNLRVTATRRFLDTLAVPGVKELFKEISLLESIRAVNITAWPRKRSNWLMSLIALAAIRITCPQSWLLEIWSRIESSSRENTEFYQVYHRESPRMPFTKVPIPGDDGPRHGAFQGMDMMLLSGNYLEQPPAFHSYQNSFQRAFFRFIHRGTMPSSCNIPHHRCTFEDVSVILLLWNRLLLVF